MHRSPPSHARPASSIACPTRDDPSPPGADPDPGPGPRLRPGGIERVGGQGPLPAIPPFYNKASRLTPARKYPAPASEWPERRVAVSHTLACCKFPDAPG
jgi:hypothetical protein